jgi:hypothetical protein
MQNIRAKLKNYEFYRDQYNIYGKLYKQGKNKSHCQKIKKQKQNHNNFYLACGS